MRKDQPDIDMSPEIRELWESEGRFRVYAGELLAEFIGSFPETLSSYLKSTPRRGAACGSLPRARTAEGFTA